jgi:hypothetical protein
VRDVQKVRLSSVPLVPALITGAWAGFVPGLFIGAIAGTLLTFGAGAALEWMRELSFTTGIEQQLLPFGNRIGLLQTLQDGWPVVIPIAAIALGLFSALIGTLTAALVAMTLRTVVRGVEFETEPVTPPAPKVVERPQEYRRAAGDS